MGARKKLKWRDGVVMTWGGLRGAVGLALAIAVKELRGDAVAEKSKQLLLFHVGGLAFCTLFFNGTSSGALLGALGMTKRSGEASMLLDQHVEKQLALVSLRIFKVRVNDMNERYRKCGIYGVAPDLEPLFTTQEMWRKVAPYSAFLRKGPMFHAIRVEINDDAGGERDASRLPLVRKAWLRAVSVHVWEEIEQDLIPVDSLATRVLLAAIEKSMDTIMDDEGVRRDGGTGLWETIEAHGAFETKAPPREGDRRLLSFGSAHSPPASLPQRSGTCTCRSS